MPQKKVLGTKNKMNKTPSVAAHTRRGYVIFTYSLKLPDVNSSVMRLTVLFLLSTHEA